MRSARKSLHHLKVCPKWKNCNLIFGYSFFSSIPPSRHYNLLNLLRRSLTSRVFLSPLALSPTFDDAQREKSIRVFPQLRIASNQQTLKNLNLIGRIWRLINDLHERYAIVKSTAFLLPRPQGNLATNRPIIVSFSYIIVSTSPTKLQSPRINQASEPQFERQ